MFQLSLINLEGRSTASLTCPETAGPPLGRASHLGLFSRATGVEGFARLPHLRRAGSNLSRLITEPIQLRHQVAPLWAPETERRPLTGGILAGFATLGNCTAETA